jgi:hypothetical protein
MRMQKEVLLIRDVYPDPVPEFFHPGSRAKNSKRHRNLVRIRKYFIFVSNKFLLSALKYDPDCLSRFSHNKEKMNWRTNSKLP